MFKNIFGFLFLGALIAGCSCDIHCFFDKQTHNLRLDISSIAQGNFDFCSSVEQSFNEVRRDAKNCSLTKINVDKFEAFTDQICFKNGTLRKVALKYQDCFGIQFGRKELEMSSAGWIFVGLLFISPFYEAAELKDESRSSRSRQRRSLVDLKDMVKAVTGREGADFINYGNWCGLGGSGKPVDPVDECCQNHDFCYDLATAGVCREHGNKGVYQLEYKWRVADDGTAVCNDEKDECKMAICFCDAIISNCLKSNIDAYDPKNYHDMDLFQLIQEADFISS